MNTCSPWKHEVKNLSLVLNSLQSWRHDGPDDRDTVKGYSRVIFKDGNDSVHLCSVDYSASVGSVETWRAVSGWARAPSAVTQWWALWPTIDVQLCGVISCLVLRVWWTGRKPPSCLCHLKNRNDWLRHECIWFPHVIFTQLNVIQITWLYLISVMGW